MSTQRKTLESAQEKIDSVYGAGHYTVILPFIGFYKKHDIKCNICKNTFNMKLHSLVHAQRTREACRYCRRTNRHSREDCQTRIDKVPTSPFILLDEPTLIDNSHSFQCKCGFTFQAILKYVFLGTAQCQKCEKLKREISAKNKFNKVHGNKIRWLYSEYLGFENYYKFECQTCKNIWDASLKNVINRASGCPNCMKVGFNKNKPGILYYIRIDKDGSTAYKIGITNFSVEERFKNGKEIKYITTLRKWKYNDGNEAHEQELNIKQEYKYAKWKGSDLIMFGNSEMFDRDILCLDTK